MMIGAKRRGTVEFADQCLLVETKPEYGMDLLDMIDRTTVATSLASGINMIPNREWYGHGISR